MKLGMWPPSLKNKRETRGTSVKFTTAEYAELQKHVAFRGQFMSDYIHAATLEAMRRDKECESQRY